MITEYGKFIRNLRKNRQETLSIMAKKLNVSIAFLSAIEIGKKQVPLDYANKISEIYNLNREENLELSRAIAKSNDTMNLNINLLSEDKAETAIIFARKISKIDPNVLCELRKLLEDESQGE